MVALLPLLAVGALVPAKPDEAYRLVEEAIRAKGNMREDEVMIRVTFKQIVTHGGSRQPATKMICINDNDVGKRYRYEFFWEEKGKSMYRVAVQDGNQLSVALNGIVEPLTATERAAERNAIHVAQVLSLRCLADRERFQLEIRPKADVEGEPCDVIRVKSNGWSDIDIYLSCETHHIRKALTTRLASDGRQHEWFDVYSDYKLFSGVWLATKRRSGATDGTYIDEKIVEKVEFIPSREANALFVSP